jgi:hypothetical protein
VARCFVGRPEEILANPFTPLAATLLNGFVFRAIRAQSRRSGCGLWGLALFVLVGACGGPTRVRLVLRVDEERFRPEHADVVWGAIGGPQRTARIPAQGSLPASGNEIATVLITLSDSQMTARRFVARGFRADDVRISGASGVLGWMAETEATLTLTLVDCYDDPGEPRLPGCPEPADGGVDDAATDAPPDLAPVDTRPIDARDAGTDGPRG